MAFGVFIHRFDSIYDDSPASRYQFPSQYLSRVEACVCDWIVYYEPTAIVASRGYFAIAKVQYIMRDVSSNKMYFAYVEPGSYLPFVNAVPFSGREGPIERGLLNDEGRISGKAQAAVRPISASDFNRIVEVGLAEAAEAVLPRRDGSIPSAGFRERQEPIFYEEERDRIVTLTSRLNRDRIFRRVVLQAYDCRCAVTGLKLINGGGRAEAEAAHIRSVEANGPDIVSNGLALSGTAHWMFDRGVISVDDNLQILISRQANDFEGIRSLINKDGMLLKPPREFDRPHPAFLAWHRENCFKA